MRRPSLVPLVLLPLVLAGCGDEPEPRSASPTQEPQAPAPPSATAPPGPVSVRLTGDGLDLATAVLPFGTTYDETLAAVTAALGPPTDDTGPVDPAGGYGVCPGTTLRVLEYGDGALQLLFGDVGGEGDVLHTWALVDAGDPVAVPQASAFVGDAATYEFGVGSVVGDLREGLGEPTFAVAEDAQSMDPAFTVQDQSSGFRGYLSGTSDGDRVTLVEAGEGCAG